MKCRLHSVATSNLSQARKKNNAKFSGHYVIPHTHNVRAHALCSHQLLLTMKNLVIFPLCFLMFKHERFCPSEPKNSCPITCYDFLVFALICCFQYTFYEYHNSIFDKQYFGPPLYVCKPYKKLPQYIRALRQTRKLRWNCTSLTQLSLSCFNTKIKVQTAKLLNCLTA